MCPLGNFYLEIVKSERAEKCKQNKIIEVVGAQVNDNQQSRGAL